LALPLYVLASYGPLENIRINLARNRRVPLIDAQHVVVEEKRAASTWSPVVRGFHEREIFRPLTGLAPIRLTVPPLARIAGARVLPYAMRERGTVYAIEVQVLSFNRQRAELVLGVADRPVSGAPQNIEQTLTLAGPLKQALSITVPVETLCAREVTLTLRDPARNEVLETVLVEDRSALNVMTAFLDRNYYTDEAQAAAVCRIGLPPESLAAMRVEVRDTAGNVLGKSEALSAESRIAFPLKTLTAGTGAVTVALRPLNKPDFFTVVLPLVKRAPKPGLEWKINQDRRVALNNAKPFFAFGMCMSGVKPDDESAFRQLADCGFNTFMVWNRGTPEDMVQYQQRAAEHGLFVIAHPDECVSNITWEIYDRYSGDLLEQVKRATAGKNLISLKSVMDLPVSIAERNAIYGEFYNKNIDRCLDAVRGVKEFANLIGYFILDEPLAATFFDQYKFGQDYYARIRTADGYHPVIVNYSSHIPEGDEYVNWCDILMTDPYWSPPAAEGTRTTPNHVSKITWMTDQRALAHRQANWQVLAGPLWSGCRKRPLTHNEQRCQTYLALIHKATGILYYAYPWVRPANWATFKQLGAEMRVLTPFIVGPAVPGEPVYRKALLDTPSAAPVFEDDPFDPLKEKYPAVQAALLADPAGAHVLLAANTRHYPVACRFELAGLTDCDVLFGGGTPARKGAVVSDTLEPYATRAYSIRLEKPLASAAALMVSQTILKADLPNPETELPFGWRSDRKNVMPNPDFDLQTAEGWPDYSLISMGGSIQRGGALFGQHCLKFEYPGDAPVAGKYEYIHAACAPQHAQPRTYTFSVYLKGSRAGLKAWMRGTEMNPEKPYGENKSVTLTAKWERYWITGVIPAKSSAGMFEIRLSEPGTMWVDGMQLEPGADPTDWSSEQ